ncbi:MULTISPECIES: DNA-binding transcriptional repressor CitR [Leclercia]|uniref:DNA-binding transcriptional repressor CitR n=1 Tax=Leclercia TaxID=83654 RepID=UPI00321927C3
MANLYDLKKFDLNLLVIFECIYQHLSISKAAETLFITPSAVSQSLQRLRNQLNDPLFIRSGKGITPTTVGVNLHKHLEQNLNQIEQTINIMHGSSLEKNIVVYAPQALTPDRLFMPMKMLIREHNYEIEYHDLMLSTETAEDLLAYRKADLIFSFMPVNNRSVICTHFLTVPMTIVCRQAHPRIGESTTQEQLNEEKYTYFITNEPGISQFRTETEKKFPERKIGFRSDSFFSLVNMISASNLLGYIPELAYQQYRDSLKLKKVNAPFELPTANIYMMYNRAALTSKIFSNFIEQISTEGFEYD